MDWNCCWERRKRPDSIGFGLILDCKSIFEDLSLPCDEHACTYVRRLFPPSLSLSLSLSLFLPSSLSLPLSLLRTLSLSSVLSVHHHHRHYHQQQQAKRRWGWGHVRPWQQSTLTFTSFGAIRKLFWLQSACQLRRLQLNALDQCELKLLSLKLFSLFFF